MKYNSVLEATGNTPLIRLNKIVDEDSADIYMKYEGLNVGGSIKTRTALNMVNDAENKGLLKEGYTIVEASSGNQGIGLALVGAVKGYKVIVVMPDSVSGERRKLIAQYGAEIRLVHDDGDIGKCISTCKETAEELAKLDGYFMPAQFDNEANVEAQRQTGREILEDLPQIDGFCSGIGTGGTITGIGSILKEKNPNMTIWAIEPENAAILSGKKVGTHIQMGIGDGVIPAILDQKIYDDICIITDEEAVAAAKLLAKKEGIIAGITSGTNIAAALKLAKKLGKGKTVVTILPDTGERYFSTSLFE